MPWRGTAITSFKVCDTADPISRHPPSHVPIFQPQLIADTTQGKHPLSATSSAIPFQIRETLSTHAPKREDRFCAVSGRFGKWLGRVLVGLAIILTAVFIAAPRYVEIARNVMGGSGDYPISAWAVALHHDSLLVGELARRQSALGSRYFQTRALWAGRYSPSSRRQCGAPGLDRRHQKPR